MALPPKTENQKVADFTLQRLFPMVDEFILAHKLKTSMEAGLIILLTQRLAYQGFRRDVLLDMVGAAYDILAIPKDAAPLPVIAAPAEEIGPPPTAQIVQFKKKR